MAYTTYRNYAEGPRWARFDKFLKKLCIELNLECDVDRDTTFLTETVYFKLKGDEYDIKLARNHICRAVDNYNKT